MRMDKCVLLIYIHFRSTPDSNGFHCLPSSHVHRGHPLGQRHVPLSAQLPIEHERHATVEMKEFIRLCGK